MFPDTFWTNSYGLIISTARLMAVAVMLLSATLGFAQADHVPLQTSSTLTFAEIYASALATVPEAMETDVREAQARDFSAVGRGWIAGVPSLQMNYYDDGLLDDVGMEEIEYGVQLPLWWPGQRKNSRMLGQSYETQVALWKEALGWVVAGRVRAVLSDIANAQVGLTLQERAVDEAERLRDVTVTLFNAGEVARLELMQAESLLVEKQAELLQAEAAMVDAERTYSVITGLNVRPQEIHSEALTEQEDISRDHPQLEYLRSQVDLLDASVRQNESKARGNPTLTIGTRQERPDRFQESLSSVGVQLSIPFGGKSIVSSQVSSTRRAKVDAEVAWQNAWIQLNQQLHEVEHDLFILGEEEPLRRTQAELSRERYEMALTAFEVGETTLAQVVLAQQEAQTSDRALRTLLLKRQQRIAEFNQLIGVKP